MIDLAVQKKCRTRVVLDYFSEVFELENCSRCDVCNDFQINIDEKEQQRVEKLLGLRPDWVMFVPIDFNTQTLDEVLGKDGFVAEGPPSRVMRDAAPWAQIGLSVPPWVNIPPVEGSAR